MTEYTRITKMAADACACLWWRCVGYHPRPALGLRLCWLLPGALGIGPWAIWHKSQTVIKRDISFPNKMAVVSLTHSLAHLLNTSLPQRLACSLPHSLTHSITLGLNLITLHYDTLCFAMPCCNAFLLTSKVQ